MPLPAITQGTDKQIARAEKIRSAGIDKLIKYIAECEGVTGREDKLEGYRILLEQFQTRSYALWFIDQRGYGIGFRV